LYLLLHRVRMQSFLCSRGHRVQIQIAKANQAKVERAIVTVDLAREVKEVKEERVEAKAGTAIADPVARVDR
jgi:nitrogen fixation protein FixH